MVFQKAPQEEFHARLLSIDVSYDRDLLACNIM